MQISLNWIKELVPLENRNLDDLIEKLTFGGFEVEEILEIEIDNQKQIAFDISSTANRSDSLSMQGISKEIAALVDKSIPISNYSRTSQNWKDNILKNVPILSKDQNCSILCFIIIENLINPRVPKWIREKLISSGITPFNNLLDFQNYILIETGYPFAFYDFDKIRSNIKNSTFDISISKATNKQEFIAGNGKKYKLDDSILIIQANEIPISIAGIIENEEFSYSDTTTSLLIEGSIFHASKIRQQSRNLGLRTDRSTRYEKSLKNTYLMESFYRLISLLKIENPNLKCKLHTIKKGIEEIQKPILLRYQRIGEILGPAVNLEYISPKEIENYLNRLNFAFFSDERKQVWNVNIPDSRTEDITREIDLIEEIGRLHGFNNFLINLPKLKRIGIEDTSYKTRQKITACLLNLGFYELIHYSLENEKTFLDNQIKLINPLVSDYSTLRISLLPHLIQTVQENLRQGNFIINGFEYGHIFLSDSKERFQEKEHIAGIFGGFKKKLSWSESEKVLTWFEAKGKIEQFFQQLTISVDWKFPKRKRNSRNHIFHSYRTAELYLTNGSQIGIFGQIHPILANQLNISSELYLFEFNLEVIANQIQINQLPIYKDYSLYPKIIKDISFIIKEDVSFQELEKILYSNGTKFLSKIQLLDEYKGKFIPDQHISLCFQLIFQSNEKTLQNKEIEEIINNIRSVLMKKFNATIRN